MAVQLDDYFEFDGTGDYLSIPDTNLLDADTAHLQQSIGEWIAYVQGATVGLSQDVTPHFGDSVLEWRRNADVATIAISTPRSGTTGVIPVDASTEYTASAWLADDDSGNTGELKITWIDSGGTTLTTSSAGTQVNLTGELQEVSVTATSHASAAFAAIEVIHRGSFTANTPKYVDAACLRAGSDPTFMPSLRIVSDLDIEADISDTYSDGDIAYLFSVNAASTTGGYAFLLRNDIGRMRMDYTENDGTARQAQSDVLSWVDGRYTLRGTWDVTAGTVVLYRDGEAVATLGPSGGYQNGGFYPSSQVIDISGINSGSGNLFDGSIYRLTVRDGIDGPAVLTIRPEDVNA